MDRNLVQNTKKWHYTRSLIIPYPKIKPKLKTHNVDLDIYSRKFAIIILVMLIGILLIQAISNYSNTDPVKTIDSETCELYISDPQINAKQYLNEFDSKCLDFKNLNK